MKPNPRWPNSPSGSSRSRPRIPSRLRPSAASRRHLQQRSQSPPASAAARKRLLPPTYRLVRMLLHLPHEPPCRPNQQPRLLPGTAHLLRLLLSTPALLEIHPLSPRKPSRSGLRGVGGATRDKRLVCRPYLHSNGWRLGSQGIPAVGSSAETDFSSPRLPSLLSLLPPWPGR